MSQDEDLLQYPEDYEDEEYPEDYEEYPDDYKDEGYENDEHKVSEDDPHHEEDQELLYRCAARYKGGIICKAVFDSASDVFEHLNQEHHTNKWLVDEFIKIQN